MNLLIKSATILDPSSIHHLKEKDILIEGGVIKEINTSITNPNQYQELALDNLYVSEGWLDTSVSFGEPGYEERETLANGLKTAALSGYTSIGLNPCTFPVTDTNTSISFVKNKALDNAVNLYPIGALTRESKGHDLAELYDMQQAGAIAFGDFQQPITNPNLLKIALQYTQGFSGLVLSFPHNNDIAGKGVVNEEENATRIGLKGIPALAEELHVARDLFLLEYTEGKLHIPTISTAKSVALIREAKAKGLDVSCSVAITHLALTDSAITDFDTHYKVLPPLRTSQDREALITGVKDGTIDYITSNHLPIDIEHKNVEFDHAKYGSIGLESSFGVLNTLFSTEEVIQILTRNKERFGVTPSAVKEGEKANLSLFTPNGESTFIKEQIISTSKNSAFIGYPTKGKAYGVINNNQINYSE